MRGVVQGHDVLVMGDNPGRDIASTPRTDIRRYRKENKWIDGKEGAD
jgi:hypothetical protein